MAVVDSYSLRPSDSVLVTGGAGFIGSHLCARLCTEGYTVHATSRGARSKGTQSGPKWWQADMATMSDAQKVFAAVEPQTVFHLAGSVGASPDRDLVLPTFHSLLTSTLNVLLMAAEHGVQRVVLAGSFTEPAPTSRYPTPGSPYAAAKWASCGYGRMFHALYGTPVVILRPFMTYGPGQASTKLIPSVTNSLLSGIAPRLSSGRVTADWVYIMDIVDAFVLAAQTPGIAGHSIDLGSGTLTSIRHVVETLVDVTGVVINPLFSALADRPSENEVAADTATARKVLQWGATTSLERGLRQTVEWHRAQRA